MSEGSLYQGACSCGRVRYQIRGPVKFVVHDHCSMCRRASGAPLVTWCGVEADQFTVTEGDDELTTYASSEAATRQFCRVCGSQLFFRSERWAEEVHVTFATLLDTGDLTPTAHVFFSDRAPWIDVQDALPRFGGTSGTEPL